MHDRVRMRLLGLLMVAGLIFLGLAARLVYLGTAGVEQMAAANGLEVETFHQYPPLMQAGAAPRPRQVRVPALTGRTFAQAGETLVGTGLLIEGKGDVHGRVIRQDPAAGRSVPEGTAIKVWLEQ